ncbi:MAG: hypothetical protein HY535_08770 [Chloroflexi bacterium]|nr:hypothetical protein [Chloroflexota bacterium]
MQPKYLGDSFDIVKRFWAERLGSIAPLFAHPRFVPTAIKSAYEKMVAMPVLHPNEPRAEPFGLFLDPHTGIPLPTALSQKPTASHVPLSFIEAELDRLRPMYLICFDQSHVRGSGPSKAEQRESKRAALQTRNVASFYYVSHAPFLFASKDAKVIELVRRRLVEGGIPECRFEP